MFVDRHDAGRKLGEEVARLDLDRPVVCALPRGGVPVGAEVAEAIGAPLDVLVVRKLGFPGQPELGMGAIAEGGVRILNERLLRQLGVSPEDVESVASAEQRELERRVAAYRGGRPAQDVADRTVVLVDDGIATGYTVRTAISVLRERRAARVVLAAPVAAPETVAELEQVADDVVCLEMPRRLLAIGAHYEDFRQTSDEEVRALLGAAAGRGGHESGPTTSAGSSNGKEIREVVVDIAPDVRLAGTLRLPAGAPGTILFAHGSGSGRHSPRNQAVAERLVQAGLGTLLFDLLTPAEALDRAKVFDIALLADRLAATTRWLGRQPRVPRRVGYFGASTGAGAALRAAAELGDEIGAVVSRGGRPDLAGEDALSRVAAPTLLIVGGDDEPVLRLNAQAAEQLRCVNRLEVVPGATHLFEEPGTLEQVAELASDWFSTHLREVAPSQR